MRVTSTMTFRQLARGVKEQLTSLTELSQRLATGKKIAKPSDDVPGAAAALGYRLSLSGNDQYLRNILRAETVLEYTETQLSQVSEVLTGLKEMVLEGSDSTLTDQDRNYYAEKAALLRDYLLDLSNATYENRYLFSGFQTDQQAYVYDPQTCRFLYQGDSGQFKLAIDRGMTQTVNFVGSSADPSLTTAFSITLDQPESITLADGSQVTYTPIPDPAAGITTIEVEITHPDHPNDPDFEDRFRFSNFMEMADLLSHAWQFEEADGTAINRSEAFRRIQALSVPLERAMKQVVGVRSELATRQIHLENQKSGLEAATESLKNGLSEVEEADLAETIVSLQQVAMSLEALRLSSSRILSQSLFDFLS